MARPSSQPELSRRGLSDKTVKELYYHPAKGEPVLTKSDVFVENCRIYLESIAVSLFPIHEFVNNETAMLSRYISHFESKSLTL